MENLVVKIDGVKFDNLIEGYYATWIKESVATVSWSTTSRLFIIILFAIDFENLLTEKILLFIEQSLKGDSAAVDTVEHLLGERAKPGLVRHLDVFGIDVTDGFGASKGNHASYATDVASLLASVEMWALMEHDFG